ncbi:AsmA-like C-terminal region-containing protein [Akkermansiaceae bacterium]|nr:AsmA-like C-terminal region-containing protein [Akkermansiaceae bacterium]
MKITRLIQRFKIGLIASITAFTSAILFSVIYLHTKGLPQRFHHDVQSLLESKGLNADFTSIKYQLNKGLVLTDLQIFSDNKHTEPLLVVEEFILDIDKSKLARGIVEIDSAFINNGKLDAPIAPQIDLSKKLILGDISGEFSLSRRNELESTDGIKFTFEGIEILLTGRVLAEKKERTTSLDQEKSQLRIYNQIIGCINELSYLKESPPIVKLELNGNLQKSQELRILLTAECKELGYKKARVKDLELQASLKNQLINLKQLSFTDSKGNFNLQADYSLLVKEGTYTIDSSVNFKSLVREIYLETFADDVQFHGDVSMKASGSIKLPIDPSSEQKPMVEMIGELKFSDIQYIQSKFDYLGTKFSWNGGSLYLTKLQAFSGDNEFNGRMLMTEDEIKFSSNSSLSPLFLEPFIRGKSYERALNHVSMNESSLFNISASGTINKRDLTQWNATGDIYIANINYKGVQIDDAGVDFTLNNDISFYNNIFLNLNYVDYSRKKEFNIGDKGNILADKVTVVNNKDTGFTTISVENPSGEFWITPVIGMFNSKTASLFSNFALESPVKLNSGELEFHFRQPKSNEEKLQFNHSIKADIAYVKLAGTPMKNISFDLNLSPGKTLFNDIKSELIYTNYPKESSLNSPTDGKIEIDSLSLLKGENAGNNESIIIKGVRGSVWPAPATKLFAPKSAQIVENIKFSAPINSKDSSLSFVKQNGKWKNIFDLNCATLGYAGVNASDVSGLVTIENNITIFENTKLNLNYSDYSQYKKYGGPKSSTINVNKVILDEDSVSISNINGVVWPGLITRAFSESGGELLEDIDLKSPLTSRDSHLVIGLGENTKINGKLNLGEFGYRKCKVNTMVSDLYIDDESLRFSNVDFNFDISSYPMRKKYSGKSSSSIAADSIELGLKSELVKLKNLRGNFWPGSAVGIFEEEVAREIDEFSFSLPPYSSTSGVLDISDAGNKTNLTTQLKADRFTYNFLDEDIPGISAQATINTTSNYVEASSLKVELLDSRAYINPTNNSTIYPLSGSFKYNFNKTTPTYSGNIAINRLSIESLADTYDFEDLNKGYLYTLFVFSGSNKGVSDLNSLQKNSFAIQNANLAKIPLLGPFSKMASTLSRRDSNGYSAVSDANGSYEIKNGILVISSLEAKSKSLTLKGAGKYNLDNERLDMTFQVSGFKRMIGFLEIVKPFINNLPIVQGVLKYKVYGDLDDIKILPDI